MCLPSAVAFLFSLGFAGRVIFKEKKESENEGTLCGCTFGNAIGFVVAGLLYPITFWGFVLYYDYKKYRGKTSLLLGRPSREKSHKTADFFRTGGGGAQPHSIAFGGVFPNITEAILVNEISTKVRKK